MADRYWVNDDADGDWEGTNNWSTTSGGSGGAATPTGSDDVYFNAASSNDNCTLSANAACNSLTIGTSGSLYTGTLDAATYNMTIGTGGLDCTYGGSATLDLGSGTWTCSGDWDSADLGDITFSVGAIIEMSGTDKALRVKDYDAIAGLTISGSTITSYNYLDMRGDLTISGTFTLAQRMRTLEAGVTWTIENGGTFNSPYRIDSYGALTIDVESGGTWTSTDVRLFQDGNYIFSTPYSFSGAWMFYKHGTNAYNLQFPSGTTTFEGAVTFASTASNTITVANNTNHPTLAFEGNITVTESAGSVEWTKGDGTITFSGTNNQTITTPASWTQVLDHITIDKSLGGVKLVNDLYANSLTVTDGDLDLNRYDLYCAGAFSVAAGARFYSFDGNFDDMQDGKIVLQNASLLTLTGSGVGTELSIYSLDFDAASGVTYAITYCDVQSSDGTGAGSPIDGSGTGNIDSGSNTGWTFTAAAVSRQLLLLGVGT